MKLRNKRFWIFEGTIMSTVLIFGIIYFSCGFSELIGASIYGVFFIYSSYCRNGYVDCLQN